MPFAPMTLTGKFMTRMIKHVQYTSEEAREIATLVIPKITEEQVASIRKGNAKLTGTSPNMNYELDAPC